MIEDWAPGGVGGGGRGEKTPRRVEKAGLRTREPSIMHSPRRRCVGKINWNRKWWNGREKGGKNDRPSADKGGGGEAIS